MCIRDRPWSERWTKIEPEEPSTTDAAGGDRAPVQADATTPASTPAASRTTQEIAAPKNNEAVLKDFVDELIARIDAGKAGQVDFPAHFTHVIECWCL